jgi:hypothetical protein
VMRQGSGNPKFDGGDGNFTSSFKHHTSMENKIGR